MSAAPYTPMTFRFSSAPAVCAAVALFLAAAGGTVLRADDAEAQRKIVTLKMDFVLGIKNLPKH
jgi:hypothetical protein